MVPLGSLVFSGLAILGGFGAVGAIVLFTPSSPVLIVLGALFFAISGIGRLSREWQARRLEAKLGPGHIWFSIGEDEHETIKHNKLVKAGRPFGAGLIVVSTNEHAAWFVTVMSGKLLPLAWNEVDRITFEAWRGRTWFAEFETRKGVVRIRARGRVVG
ncbi:MAG: hypothetical protein AAGC53_10460 [Actinomycetota bacterium]